MDDLDLCRAEIKRLEASLADREKELHRYTSLHIQAHERIDAITAKLAAILMACPCNCHETWWAEQGSKPHKHCGECTAALLNDAEQDREACMAKLAEAKDKRIERLIGDAGAWNKLYHAANNDRLESERKICELNKRIAELEQAMAHCSGSCNNALRRLRGET